MLKRYDLAHFEQIRDDFMPAYSPICKVFPDFAQEKDCLVNFKNSDAPEDFAYISTVTKTRYTAGAVATVHCSFEKYGAPLIVFTDDFSQDAEGRSIYGLHYEVVAFEEGFNVWHIVPNPQRPERPISPTKVGFARFPVDANSIVEIQVRFGIKEITVAINGVEAVIPLDDMPECFHVGFTACEGINRFYDFSIEA